MNADRLILLGDSDFMAGPWALRTWAGGGGGEADEAILPRLIRWMEMDLGLAAITFISRHIFRVPAIFRVEKMAGREIREQ